MKNLSRHTDLELDTSLLMRGIQMGEMSRLGWLFGLTGHAIWADSCCDTCHVFGKSRLRDYPQVI
jgi:hypothetical protein